MPSCNHNISRSKISNILKYIKRCTVVRSCILQNFRDIQYPSFALFSLLSCACCMWNDKQKLLPQQRLLRETGEKNPEKHHSCHQKPRETRMDTNGSAPVWSRARQTNSFLLIYCTSMRDCRTDMVRMVGTTRKLPVQPYLGRKT